MAVIGVLTAVLVPALASAQSAAQRVACASNVKQLGIGLAAYAFDWDDRLPPSVASLNPDEWITSSSGHVFHAAIDRPQDSLVIRLAPSVLAQRQQATSRVGVPVRSIGAGWDGLGTLYATDHAVPEVYYCPAHSGDHPFERYAERFTGAPGEVVGNYQYRAEAAKVRINRLPSYVSLIANGMRTQADYSHAIGHNFLRADGSVEWFADKDGSLLASLPVDEVQSKSASGPVDDAWDEMDTTDAHRPWEAPHHSGGGGHHSP